MNHAMLNDCADAVIPDEEVEASAPAPFIPAQLARAAAMVTISASLEGSWH